MGALLAVLVLCAVAGVVAGLLTGSPLVVALNAVLAALLFVRPAVRIGRRRFSGGGAMVAGD